MEERQELIEFVRSGDTGGWWERPLPGVPQEMGLLASYASEATSLTDWSLMLVPGLLQIEPYARALWLADGVSPEDADLRWVARKRRQSILGKIDYAAFIHEAALHVPFGGPLVHREQIRHLLGARDRGVSVRVSAGAAAQRHVVAQLALHDLSECGPGGEHRGLRRRLLPAR